MIEQFERLAVIIKNRWCSCFLFCDYLRLLRLYRYYGVGGIKYLLPHQFYLDFVEIPITTRCNLHCPGCANLMPLYEKPSDLNSETIIHSIRKIAECVDICGQFRLLGGEPFLHPDLKRFIAEIPSEKCKKISIATNATIVPNDEELYALLRQKRVTVVVGNYPSAVETQSLLIEKLKQEGVKFEIPRLDTWIYYGNPINHGKSNKELKRQFIRCNLRSKSVVNGYMYYCPRHAHGYDLGIMGRRTGEYVDLLHNTKEENRRQIRKLMWRHDSISACQYCLRGTDKAISISRGK